MQHLQRWMIFSLMVFMGWTILARVPVASCEEYRFGFGVAPSFSSGDYGTDQDVDIFYLPLIFKFYPSESLRFTGVVPWLVQSSTQVVSVGGMFHGLTGRNLRDAPGARDSETGLGDIVLRAEYDLLEETPGTPAVILEGMIKLPTASESKGLGTGEMDGGVAVELGRSVNSNYLYGRVGYTVVGDPSGVDLDNTFLYEGGVGVPINSRIYLNASLEGATSVDDDIDDPLEGVVNGNYLLRRDLSVNGFISVGLSDGSPDFSFGVGYLKTY